MRDPVVEKQSTGQRPAIRHEACMQTVISDRSMKPKCPEVVLQCSLHCMVLHARRFIANTSVSQSQSILLNGAIFLLPVSVCVCACVCFPPDMMRPYEGRGIIGALCVGRFALLPE